MGMSCSADSLKLCYPRCNESRTQLLAWCLTGRREHITPVPKELHWLPVRQQISFKVLVLTYQALYGTAPQYMTDLLSRYQPTRSLRSSDALLLTAPQSRLASFGDRPFRHATPRLWNGLPISLRSANNLNSFKKALKTFLFKDAYNVQCV